MNAIDEVRDVVGWGRVGWGGGGGVEGVSLVCRHGPLFGCVSPWL